MRHVLLPVLASALLLAGLAEGRPAWAADAPPGASSCTGCHAARKIPDSVIPRIAGRKAADIVTAMREYKSGARRAYEPIMVEVLQPIGDSLLVEFAYYLSHLR